MKKLFYLLIGVLFFCACQTQGDLDAFPEPNLPKIVSVKAAVSSDQVGSPNVQYLELKIDPSGVIPDLLLVKGHPLYDDGKGFDLIAGDNIYSTIDQVTFDNNNINGRVTELEWFVTCKFEVTKPGDDCGGEECPKKTAWGNKTWFCVCLSDCSFCFGDDCAGK